MPDSFIRLLEFTRDRDMEIKNKIGYRCFFTAFHEISFPVGSETARNRGLGLLRPWCQNKDVSGHIFRTKRIEMKK